MKARYKHLLDHSVGMMLSAMELYNKPDFKNREQIFTILSVASWESLLKAKILKDNKNRLTSLYVKQGSRYKKNRSGSYMTIGIERAMSFCGLPSLVLENLNALIQIRDAAIHLTADSPTLPYLVFSLGSASLQNYSKLIKSWFDRSLSEYNFYILPLGFTYPFKKIRSVDAVIFLADTSEVSISHRRKNPEEFATLADCESATNLITFAISPGSFSRSTVRIFLNG